MRRLFLWGLGVVLLSGALVAPATARGQVGERIGERVERGLRQLSSELREEWADIRKSVERMSVHGRVYSRLRWDKHIDTTTIDIEVRDNDVVVLRGSVPTVAAKQKAVQLTRDTVGVASVVDELTVAATEQPPR